MAKRKRPIHLVILGEIEARFKWLKEVRFDSTGKNSLRVTISVDYVKKLLEILREAIIPKGAVKRIITRLERMSDTSGIPGALYDSFSETVENLQQRK